MKKLDLTGRRFGHLLVLAEDPNPYRSPGGKPTRRWLCQCDCGNRISVLQSALTTSSNPTRSCGCVLASKKRSSANDMTGQRFGRLLVLGPTDLPSPMRNGLRLGWRCRCDCGKEIVTTRKSLLAGKKSCGCLIKEVSAESVDQRVGHTEGTQLTAIRPDRPANKNSKSGIKGVYWSARDGCWIAKIGFQGRTFTLGRFSRVEDATAARHEAEQKYFAPLLNKEKDK